MPVGYIFDIEFSWGFQSRIVGLSKTSPSFYYPPPTTLLGALAETIAKEYNIGEYSGKELIPELSKNLLAIGIRPINCIPIKYNDINRIISIRSAGGVQYPTPADVHGSFDAPARGKTIFSTLDGDPPTIRCIMIFKDNKVYVKEKILCPLKEHIWKIHRIGSRESIVSVADVRELEISKRDILSSGVVHTFYSFPANGSKSIPLNGRWENETYINPFKIEHYSETDNPVVNYLVGKKTLLFKVPILTQNKPIMTIELKENVFGYKCLDEGVVVGYGIR
jgi:CRISPR-associated protein Cas5a/b/c